MALFEKTLQGIKDLDSVLSTAKDTFQAERKRLMDTYKDAVFAQKVKEIKRVYDETQAQQKALCLNIVQEEFSAVREKVSMVVTAAPPADFPATLEAIRASGKAISEYEAAALLEKYKGNYLAYRTLAEVLHQFGRAKGVLLNSPDSLMEELEDIENMVKNWIMGYSASSYMTALLTNHTNPVTALAGTVQEFLDGQYTKV